MNMQERCQTGKNNGIDVMASVGPMKQAGNPSQSWWVHPGVQLVTRRVEQRHDL